MREIVPIALIFTAGGLMLVVAFLCAMRQVQYVIYTHRDFTDFSGDVTGWLRSNDI